MSIDAGSVWRDVVRIRSTAPLVHNITNYVVMNSTANALLALGASPVMAHAEEEVEDMVQLAGALVINIGTLSAAWIRSMHRAMRQAQRLGLPIVFDPVGAGATPYRTNAVHDLIAVASPTVVRGNASEIDAIALAGQTTKGVDSTASSESALQAARQFSIVHGCTVCISGATDYVLTEVHLVKVHNGHPLMSRVTGLGCTATALCGAFAAVNDSPLIACAHAMAVLGIAGEMAVERSSGPGSLQIALLDALHNMAERDIAERLKVEV